MFFVQLKALARAEENTPEFLFRSMCRMAAADRMTKKQAVEAAIKHTLMCFSKFSDSRIVSEVILDTLAHLASSQGGVGVPYLVDQGGCKAVLDYLKKTPYSVKAQVNGLRTIGAVLSNSSDYVEALRSYGKLNFFSNQTEKKT